MASPIANWTIVEDVGTIFPGPASFTLGTKILTSEFLYKTDLLFDVIPISLIFLFLEQYWIIFYNSLDDPLKLIKITISFELISPKSPWLALDASRKKEDVPVDENVADHFLPIIPLFPTPEIIIFPFLQFKIIFTIWLNEFPIDDFNFFKDSISSSITFFAINWIFLFFI